MASEFIDVALHPSILIMQWHITERCNWRCAHCYQEAGPTSELQFRDLVGIVGQFQALLHHLNRSHGDRFRGHINVSGGEPFIREDFFDLLRVFHEARDDFSYGILTNGSFINDRTADRLKKLGPRFVQVSLEGGPEVNDSIRGHGAFKKITTALAHLKNAGVPATISFTAHRDNYTEFPSVARIARKYGVRQVWSDRLIPYGEGEALRDQGLTPDETREYFEIMADASRENMQPFSRTEVSMNRALQFLVGGGRPYRCGAGDRLVTVLSDGELVPCRRMPIPVGNLMQTSLVDLYLSHPLLVSLRDTDRVSKGCEDCKYVQSCRGGLRCLAYAITGNPFNADPGCWLANQPIRTSTVNISDI